ncbi:hypothetical protein V6N11_030829 [Hibiscus sabdariffa]|uniref:Uncharacterized protein n=1 Tax=Hibiscus sabdariffa TaxID=183260 RepID=A0ABR2AHG2_9ROSI
MGIHNNGMELIGNPVGVAKSPGLFINGVKDELFVMGFGGGGGGVGFKGRGGGWGRAAVEKREEGREEETDLASERERGDGGQRF